VDTKYEFGKTKEGVIVLIDEIHTPDSSHIFIQIGYQEGIKEKSSNCLKVVRRWLIRMVFKV
jgi:phosphoribosylaminoimidazole-succinocarboxamide synthase